MFINWGARTRLQRCSSGEGIAVLWCECSSAQARPRSRGRAWPGLASPPSTTNEAGAVEVVGLAQRPRERAVDGGGAALWILLWSAASRGQPYEVSQVRSLTIARLEAARGVL